MINGPIPAFWAPQLRSMLRIVAAFAFIAHGTQKLFTVPVNQPRNPVELFSLLGLAGVLEFFDGALLQRRQRMWYEGQTFFSGGVLYRFRLGRIGSPT